MIGGLKQWFIGLSRREQILIGVMGILLAIVVIGYGMIRPLWLGSGEARRSFETTAQSAAKLEARHALLQSAPLPTAQSSGSLSQLLTAEASERGITLTSNAPLSVSAATISVEGVNPNTLMQWLVILERKGIAVQQLSMQPSGNGLGDTVTARIDLARLGS